MLTVRLDPTVAEALAAHCRRARVTKSEIVNRLLRSFLDQQRPAQSFFDAAKANGFIGGQEGPADLSVNRKRYLRDRHLKKRAR